ncbi:hypothetical protein [Streptomyces sp. cg35]|uniref:hypothetical protein n=1 Tax=Streptomyces sp. cg35 TaxID=3421650 RepID=UPI003D1708EA
MTTLQKRDVKAVLPDAAALPGWRHIGRSRVETDPYTCMIWTRKDPCRDVLVTGSANFTRGPQRTTRWLRFSFFVFSCRTTSAAHHLYSKLPDYRPLPAEAKRPKLGDESAASRNLLNGEHPTAEIYNKIRVGHTVVLTFAAGLEKAVTAERAEKAARLQTERVLQAHHGFKPTAQATRVP